MDRFAVCRPGAAAQRVCAALVRDAQRRDPLALVTIAVPNPPCGVQLRRALAADADGLGIANVRTVPLASVAYTLGGPRVRALGQRPLTPALQRAFVQAAIAAHPEALHGLGGHRATLAAVTATLDELATASDAALDALAARFTRNSRELVTIERTRRALSTNFYTTHDLFAHAAAAVHDGDASTETIGQLVLYCTSELQHAAAHLCEALATRGHVRAVAVTLDDAVGDSIAAPTFAALASWLTPDAALPSLEPAPMGTAPAVGPVAPTTVVHAPEADDELRWIARDLNRRAEAGMPLHHAAIVMRDPDHYRRVALQSLRRFGIEHNGRSERALSSTAAGRAVLGVLHLAQGSWRRNDLISWLRAAPIRDPHTGAAVPVTDFDAVTRRAGIVVGLDQYRTKLRTRTTSHDAEIPPPVADPASAVLQFVTALAADMQLPEHNTWPAWSAWLRGLVERYVGTVDDIAHWPETEVVAYERVVGTIDALEGLDVAPGHPDLATVQSTVAELLDAAHERTGTFGRGVFVGTTDDVAGCAFDVVYIVGMAEGLYPPRGSENPLLRDADREACMPDAPRQRDRAARERRTHLHAMACAPDVVVTYPRGDVRAQRSYLAAPLLVEGVAARIGAPVAADDVVRGDLDFVVGIDSFAADLRSGTPLTRNDAFTAALAQERRAVDLVDHPLVLADPRLHQGFVVLAGRAGPALDEYGGNVGRVPGLLADRPQSPTALEQWARCPFRYFLAHVLHLDTIERPEEVDAISPADRGSLIHAILEGFISEAPTPPSPWAPWTNEDRALLLGIARREFTRYEAVGNTGRPLVWKLTQRQILHLLARFCDDDERLRAQRGVVPSHTEVAFGFERDDAQAPVQLSLSNGRTASFRGRIDRIDRAPGGGKLVVTDYKTGRPTNDWAGFDPVAAGRHLQLAVYALAAQRLVPDAEVEAYYWYLNSEQDPEQWADATFPLVTRRLHDVADHMFDGIEAGHFPAVPGPPKWLYYSGLDSWEHCEHCPFDRVCPLERGDDAERTSLDAARNHYLSLTIDAEALDTLRTEIEGEA